MIRVPGVPGIAFGLEVDGDGRADMTARSAIAASLGISAAWAVVDQVHGGEVASVTTSGHHGEADAMVTAASDLPLAIGTADCLPVAIITSTEVAIAHAGWRGVVNRVVANTVETVREPVQTVVIGPHIGPCCFEVGPEVIDQLAPFGSTTTWGTTSVDLSAAVRSQIPGPAQVIDVDRCTMCDESFASYRRDRTNHRQVSLVWR